MFIYYEIESISRGNYEERKKIVCICTCGYRDARSRLLGSCQAGRIHGAFGESGGTPSKAWFVGMVPGRVAAARAMHVVIGALELAFRAAVFPALAVPRLRSCFRPVDPTTLPFPRPYRHRPA